MPSRRISPLNGATIKIVGKAIGDGVLVVTYGVEGEPSIPIEDADVKTRIIAFAEPGTVEDDQVRAELDPSFTPQSGDEAPPPAFFASGVSVSPLKVAKIQAALCLRGNAIDGIWGQQTKQMLIKYQENKEMNNQDGILSEDLKSELLDLEGGEIGTRCAG